jgi:stearoyl-CoA desaturase (delta-9 desaturase)
LGLVWDLKRFPKNEIERGRVAMLQKRLDEMKAKIDYGVPVEHLPTVSWDDFKRRCTQGEKLTVVFNIVHDVSEFIADHPVRNISVFIIQGRYYRLSNSKIKR